MSKKNLFSLIGVIVFFSFSCTLFKTETVKITNLRCEYLENPLGIDITQPRLSWILDSDIRTQKQTAYEILVAGSIEKLNQNNGDLWSTGKVDGDQAVHVVYEGKTLQSGMRCFWKVRVWDKDGKPAGWSEPAMWTMGLLKKEDWKAQWIGLERGASEDDEENDDESRRLPARYLRKEFSAAKKVKRAVAYISGLGLSELYINGEKTGDSVLEPGLTEYTKRVFYVTYDVTDRIRSGENAVGVILGNGRYYAPRSAVPTNTRTYGYPKLLYQMVIEYNDNSSQVIVSDESWKISVDGPIRANNEYDGEEYDARMEMPGWNAAGFDESNWEHAEPVKSPEGTLKSQMMEPIRVTEIIKPVSVKNPRPGMYVFDLGQNMVGWCRLKVTGEKGTEVILRHAETLKKDGTLYVDNLRSAKAADIYILKGGGMEIYEPRFTYHGFRYVEVTGFPGEPGPEAIEGCVVHDDLESAGGFQCSNELINRIYKNICWGVRGNYRSFPTDCPQRDERLAWLGDRAMESKGETYLFNVARFYAKWMEDINDSQKESGSVPVLAPPYWPIYADDVTWPSCYTIIPGIIYRQYGDVRILNDQYPGMKKWMDHMSGYLENGIMPRDQYGDWCVPPESQELIHSKDPNRITSKEVLGTTYYYYNLRLMARYANIIGKPDDEKEFKTLALKVKEAFNDKYFNQEKSRYDNGTQTSYVLPLAFGMVPEDQKQRVFERLIEKIIVESKGHIGTGLIGGQWLMRLLSDNGRSDIAYTIAGQKTYPSWGYMIENDATTIWELWNGNTADPAMNSHNHLMLVGDLNIWLYECLAGIRSDSEKVGFKNIIMKPGIVGDLSFVNASYKSVRGLIQSEWRIEEDDFIWNIIVPVNSTAKIHVPAKNAENITESGKDINNTNGVQFLGMEDNAAVFTIESGNYSFISKKYSE